MASTKDHESERDALTASLEGQTIWNASTLTYIFAMDANRVAFISDPSTSIYDFTGSASFNALAVADVDEANIRSDIEAGMAAWYRVASIPLFVQTTDYAAADIKIAGVDNYGPAGAMYLPGTNPKPPIVLTDVDYESYLLINTTLPYISARAELGGGHFGIHLALHELGHGLGLAHPHDTAHGTTAIADIRADVPDPAYDNERYTVMSYERGGWNQISAKIYGHAVTPMAMDILAIQNMYGAKSSYEGNTVYTLTDAVPRPWMWMAATALSVLAGRFMQSGIREERTSSSTAARIVCC